MPFKSYIQYLTYEKRSSKHTIEAYQNDLRDFFAYCDQSYEVKLPNEITQGMVRSWMAGLADQGLEPRSISRKLSSLRSFYNYLLKNQEVNNNPLKRVVAPKIKKRLPVFVDETRMDELFKAQEESSDYLEFLKQAIVELFYATGMRLSELVELQLKNYAGNLVKVLGKRNKERLIPLTENAINAIEAYLAQRKTIENVIDPDHLFLLPNGKKLYQKFVYRVVNSYLAQVTTEKKKSPHVLRHTFATHLLNNGAELNAVKELLGHSSLAATQVYTHNTINKLINIHQKAHPLEKRKAG